MINKMVKEKKYGLMVLVMKDYIIKEKNMEMVYLNGLMDLFMKENFIKTIFKDKVNIDGKMVENILENGKIIKWMAKEYIIMNIYLDIYLVRW